MALSILVSSYAQTPPCAGMTIGLTGSAAYPPMAYAAHVTGTVDLLVSFDPSGEIAKVHSLSGPPMLVEAAEKLVAGLHANPASDGNIRDCRMVVTYDLRPSHCFGDISYPDLQMKREDMQHWTVSATGYALCDPAGDIGLRHHFLFIHWNSKNT